MKREIDIKTISDGRIYAGRDMVRAGTGGCSGCHKCCEGMADTIIVSPRDVWRMKKALGCSFQELMETSLTLSVVDGLILPHIAMSGKACFYLNASGRCSIHKARPDICRLFPLGRIYEGDDFGYFLQKDECPAEMKTKVKVSKWIGESNISEYENYIRIWHRFLRQTESLILSMPEIQKKASLIVLQDCFVKDFEGDFYTAFYGVLREIRERLGLSPEV